jgi:hypothetical protein
MQKHAALLALLALFAGAAQAESPDTAGSRIANMGIAADLGTTAVGLAMGAAEANPLGLATIPLKFIVKAQIEKIPEENQRREAMAQFTGVQFGAAAANLCTLAVGHPAVTAVCLAGGLIAGYNAVKSVPTETDCMHKHMAQLQQAAATGRVYRISVKTCEGAFEPGPMLAQSEAAPAQ